MVIITEESKTMIRRLAEDFDAYVRLVDTLERFSGNLSDMYIKRIQHELSHIERLTRQKFRKLCTYYNISDYDMKQTLELLNLILTSQFIHRFSGNKLDSISLDDFGNYDCDIIKIIKYKLGEEDSDYRVINTEYN